MTRKSVFDKPAIVYCARCAVNGKKYIGVTTRKLNKRVSEHKLFAKRHLRKGHFYKAIRKHGIEQFVFFVLEEYESMAIALQREIELIANLKPEYNNTIGGEGVCGYKHSEESRRRMSERNKGKTWAKGYKMTADHKAKLLALNLGSKKPNSVAPDNSKKVICLDDGNIFSSGAEAARFYGCHETQVRDVCKQKPHRRFAAGRIFRFYDQYVKNNMTLEQERTVIPPQGSWCCKRVICLNDKKVFESATAAALFYNSTSSAIAAVCSNRKSRITVKGRRFMYYVGPLQEVA